VALAAVHQLDRLLEDLRRTRSLVTPEELVHRSPEALPTGLASFDRLLGGGLPRGRLVELSESKGALGTGLALHLMARLTRGGRLVALVDRAGAFDPGAAASTRVDFRRLLWCRPTTHHDAIRAADLLLSSSAFSLVVIDFGLVSPPPRRRMASAPALPQSGQGPVLIRTPPVQVGGVPEEIRPPRRRRQRDDAPPGSGAWLRLCRDAESARASLLVLGGAGAGAFASASLRPLATKARFSGQGPGRIFEGLTLTLSLERNRLGLPPGQASIDLAAPELFPEAIRDPRPGALRVREEA